MLDLLRKLGLTKQDAAIIGFLLVTFAAGLIIKVSGWNNPQRTSYDYSLKDRQFEMQVKSAFSELKSETLSPPQELKLKELKALSDSLSASKDDGESSDKILPGLDRKLNINEAYSPDFQILPGIGEVTAERIIEYREQHGRFREIEEIMNVKGIGQKKFDKIKNYITVE